MKKTKFLAFVLVIAIAAMGAGYAYWTQALNITSTVNTGDLKLEFLPRLEGSDEFLFPDHGSYAYFDGKLLGTADYMTVNSEISGEENDKIEFTIDGIYPGSAGYLNFRIVNTGTVPATLTSIEPIVTENDKELLDNFDFTIHSLTLYEPIHGKYFDFLRWKWVYYEKVDWDFGDGWDALPIVAEDFDDFVNKLSARLGSVTLEPGMFFEINGEGAGYTIGLPATFSDNDLEGLVGEEAIKFSLNLEFTQGD